MKKWYKPIGFFAVVAATLITMWFSLEPPRESWMLLAPLPGVLLALAIMLHKRRRQDHLK